MKALKRKKAFEQKLLNQKKLDGSIRYQIRNGINDIKVMLKYHDPTEYQQYKEISLDVLDPSEEYPKVETTVNEIVFNPDLNVVQTDAEGFKEVKKKNSYLQLQRIRNSDMFPLKS